MESAGDFSSSTGRTIKYGRLKQAADDGSAAFWPCISDADAEGSGRPLGADIGPIQ